MSRSRAIRAQRHPPEVEESVKQRLRDLGSPTPDAFLANWTLEEIVPAMTNIILVTNKYHDIENPAGLLWRTLEDTYGID